MKYMANNNVCVADTAMIHSGIDRSVCCSEAGVPLIVVVDNEHSFRAFMEELLTAEGYLPLLWPTAAGAVDVICHTQPALVILDLWLEHRRAGWLVLRQLQTDPRTMHIPVILCSADDRTLECYRSVSGAAPATMLPKPFEVDALLAQVQAALSKERSSQ